jgi:hypothetical protein
MWSKLVEYLAKFLLIPLLKKGFTSVVSWWTRKKEQEKRHAENKVKAENYANAKPGEVRDEFENMP